MDEAYIQAVQEQVRAALLNGWEVVIKPPCDEEPDDVEDIQSKPTEEAGDCGP